MKLFSVKNASWLFMTTMVAAATFAFGQAVQLPEGEGKAILEMKCTTCHDLDLVTMNRLSKEDWTNMIAVMVASGAEVTEAETTILVEYLTKNFGPDSPPAP